jgi:4-amino-4-deoxy-L-arabinose transferase-like glycosyltransferase
LLVRLPLLSANGGITAGDGPVYFRVAHSLLDGNGLAGNDYRPPGYPAAIVPALLIDRVLGRGEAEILLSGQELLGILLAIAILFVGARHFGLWVGVGTGLLAAVSPVLPTIERFTYPDLMYACALFAATALLAEGIVRGGDRRWLAASGVVFGLSAYLKPSAQPLVVVPLIAMLLTTRGTRQAWVGGAIAAGAAVIVMAPWLVYNATQGTVGMSQEGGLTLFYRAFDDDRLPIPTDVRDGPLMRDIQVHHPTRPHDRLYERTWVAVDGTRLPQDEAFARMRHAATTAIRRHAGRYLVRTADDVRRTMGDLAETSPAPSEAFQYYDYLHSEIDSARVAVPPTAVAWRVVQVGIALGVVWIVVTLYGLTALALPFARDPEVRGAGCAFLVTWLVAAITTALSHGSLWRYSAGLAPLAWIAGSAGAAIVWSEVARTAGSLSGVPSRRGS